MCHNRKNTQNKISKIKQVHMLNIKIYVVELQYINLNIYLLHIKI